MALQFLLRVRRWSRPMLEVQTHRMERHPSKLLRRTNLPYLQAQRAPMWHTAVLLQLQVRELTAFAMAFQ